MTGGPAVSTPVRAVAAVAALCGAFALTLGAAVAGQRSPTGLDAAFETGVERALGDMGETWVPWVSQALVAPTEPLVVLTVLAVIAGFGVVRRRADVVVLAVAGPSVAVAVNTWVLKPMFARHYDDHLAYPSGHTVSLVATLTVLVLLAGTRRARLLTIGCGTALTAGAAVGMAALEYHYLTDVVGGAATAVAVVSGLALLGNAVFRPERRAKPPWSACPRRPGPGR